MSGLDWPSHSTLRLQQAFKAAGFSLADTFMGEWALFAQVDPETFQTQYCLDSDECVRRNMQHGFIGGFEDKYRESSEAFLQSQTWRQKKPALVGAAKQSESEAFRIDREIDLSTRPLFRGYLEGEARKCGFVRSSLKDIDIVGRPLEMRVRDNLSLVWGPSHAKVWSSFGAIGSTCVFVHGSEAIRVNVDSLLPGLGQYRVYDNWRDAALGACALIHAHKSLAESVSGDVRA